MTLACDCQCKLAFAKSVTNFQKEPKLVLNMRTHTQAYPRDQVALQLAHVFSGGVAIAPEKRAENDEAEEHRPLALEALEPFQLERVVVQAVGVLVHGAIAVTKEALEAVVAFQGAMQCVLRQLDQTGVVNSESREADDRQKSAVSFLREERREVFLHHERTAGRVSCRAGDTQLRDSETAALITRPLNRGLERKRPALPSDLFGYDNARCIAKKGRDKHLDFTSKVITGLEP